MIGLSRREIQSRREISTPCRFGSMNDLFEARSVTAETVRIAYALAVLAYPGLTLSAFRKEATKTRAGELTGIFDRRGYIHALFRSRITTATSGGGMMDVRDLILSDAIAARLLNGMVAALVRHARDKGCDEMTVTMAPSPLGTELSMVKTLENNGFFGKAVALSRRL